ncbi:hypothetical protein YPPY03_2398, partial [Yersinia pestis PY-03]
MSDNKIAQKHVLF